MRIAYIVALVVIATSVAAAYAFAQSEQNPAKYASKLLAASLAASMTAVAYKAYIRAGTTRSLLLYAAFTAMSVREAVEAYGRITGNYVALPWSDVPASDVAAMAAYMLILLALLSQ